MFYNKFMNKEVKRIIFGIVAIVVLTFATIFVTNIVIYSSIPSIISNETWVNYIGGIAGSIIGAITSFIILYTNNKDTREIEEANRKFQEDSMKSKNYSKIVFTDVLSIYRENNGTNRLKFKLNDSNGIPLKTMKIDKMHMLRSDKRYADYDAEKKENLIYDRCGIANLEYTPEQFENGHKIEEFYYANFILDRNIEDMLINKCYKLVIDMEITNIFGVSIKQKYYLMVECNEDGKFAKDGRPILSNNSDGIVTYLKVFHCFTNYDLVEYKVSK